jgi:hypothetical protein
LEFSPFSIHDYAFLVFKKEPDYLIEVAKEILNSNKSTIKLVRNPYKRAVSSFLAIMDPRMEYLQEHIKSYLIEHNYSSKGVSFKQFLYYIQGMGVDSEFLDPHISQQYHENEEIYIQNYIKLEDFSQQIKKIEEKYGLIKSDLSKLTQSAHHHAPSMKYKGNYAEADITDPSFPKYPTYESFYNEETMELVTKLFKKDFEVYKYEEGVL